MPDPTAPDPTAPNSTAPNPTAPDPAIRHFLDLDAVPPAELRGILDRAAALKRDDPKGARSRPLAGRTLALIFEKSSTRTRVSFEVGMKQLGGEVVVLSAADLQLGRGETVADTARVLSRYVDAIMIRTFGQDRLMEMAANATVPVINGLTDDSHPCQLMADLLTFEERKGPIEGRTVAWCGDGNNVARSWMQAAAAFRFRLRLACPEPLMPPPAAVEAARARGAEIELGTDPEAAVRGADCVVTDTWVSMGDRDAGPRHNLLKPFQVDDRLMRQAGPDPIFMHCLPAHRGEEVTASVIDGPRSAVWDEAENRLHAQKGILLWCLA